jgi:hypothetical protein
VTTATDNTSVFTQAPFICEANARRISQWQWPEAGDIIKSSAEIQVEVILTTQIMVLRKNGFKVWRAEQMPS